MFPDSQAEPPADFPAHSDNPYAPAVVQYDDAREFLDTYLPDLVGVMGFTWDVAQPLSTAYLAQCVVLTSEQFDTPDLKTRLRALSWELGDHVRAVNYLTPIRPVQIPEEPEGCDCGRDHHLEANALATFLECSVRGDNDLAVKVLDALWKDSGANEPREVMHVGASLLTHVIGSMVFARFHHDCSEHD